VYVGVTIPMAIRAEEAFLRRTFGPTYDLYQRDEAPPMLRRFSLANARRNREYRAALGSSAGLRFLPRGFCCRYNRFFARVASREVGSSRGLARRSPPPPREISSRLRRTKAGG
jgi:hypothetical protein